MSQTIQPWLRQLLRCPACRSELADSQPDGLTCVSAQCALRYPIEDGIPVLLVTEAVPTGAREAGGQGE